MKLMTAHLPQGVEYKLGSIVSSESERVEFYPPGRFEPTWIRQGQALMIRVRPGTDGKPAEVEWSVDLEST